MKPNCVKQLYVCEPIAFKGDSIVEREKYTLVWKIACAYSCWHENVYVCTMDVCGKLRKRRWINAFPAVSRDIPVPNKMFLLKNS